MLTHYARFVAARPLRRVFLATLTARFAFFGVFTAALRAFGANGNSNAGNERGNTCCAKLTAASAACFTVDSTVLRVSFHTEFAAEKEVSSRLPTKRTACDSTTVPSLTRDLNMSPASVCTQSRVTTAAPRLASHT